MKNAIINTPKSASNGKKNGSDQGGCKKENCSFYHPKLCHQSVKERKCFKKSCKFFHLKGTKTFNQLQESHRQEYFPSHGDRDLIPPRNTSETDRNSQHMFNQRGSAKQARFTQDKHESYTQAEEVSLRKDFLEFKSEIMDMITRLSQETKDSPPVTTLQRGRRLSCHCSPH